MILAVIGCIHNSILGKLSHTCIIGVEILVSQEATLLSSMFWNHSHCGAS